MSALQCQSCKSVWLGAHAGVPMETSGSHGCLRCDGELRPVTEEQVQAHLDSLRQR
jgi:hypothetical protein